MKIRIRNVNEVSIAELVSDKVEIHTVHDALQVMMDCAWQGAAGILLAKENLAPEFFDLKSGIAGEVLQKFSNNRIKLAVVGDFEDIKSESMKAFILESNRLGHINFLNSTDVAMEVLSR